MDRRSPPTSTPWPGPWRCWSSTSGAFRTRGRYADQLAARLRACRSSSAIPASASLPPPRAPGPTAPAASRLRARWPSSCSASFGRSSPSTADGPAPAPSTAVHARTGRRSGPALLAGTTHTRRSSRSDPAAGVLASLAGATSRQRLAAPGGLPDDCRRQLPAGPGPPGARRVAAGGGSRGPSRLSADPEDWRSWWWQAVLEMAERVPKDAAEDFDRVAAELPGELAPLLGLATAAESDGDGPTGGRALRPGGGHGPRRTPPPASGSRGSAERGRRSSGRGRGAAPGAEASSAYQAAQAALCTVLTATTTDPRPGVDDLTAASDVLVRLSGDARLRASVTRDLLVAALDWSGTSSGTGDSRLEMAGVPDGGAGSARRPRDGSAGRWPSSRPPRPSGWRWSTRPTRSGPGR